MSSYHLYIDYKPLSGNKRSMTILKRAKKGYFDVRQYDKIQEDNIYLRGNRHFISNASINRSEPNDYKKL